MSSDSRNFELSQTGDCRVIAGRLRWCSRIDALGRGPLQIPRLRLGMTREEWLLTSKPASGIGSCSVPSDSRNSSWWCRIDASGRGPLQIPRLRLGMTREEWLLTSKPASGIGSCSVPSDSRNSSWWCRIDASGRGPLQIPRLRLGMTREEWLLTSKPASRIGSRSVPYDSRIDVHRSFQICDNLRTISKVHLVKEIAKLFPKRVHSLPESSGTF